MGKLYNIQVLRGLAAIMVAVAHLGVAIPLLKDLHLAPIINGAAGVDIFFVISGFIMVYTTEASRPTPAGFLRSRAVRIVPLYWLITVAVFFAALAVPRLFPQVAADLPHLLASLLFLPQDKLPLVYVGWSLNFEVMFYALFAVGLAIGGRARVLFPALFIVAGALIGLAGRGGPWGHVLTDSISLEFCGGMALGCMWPRLDRSRMLALVVLVVAFVVILTGPYPLERDSSWMRVAVWGVPAFFVVGAALVLERQGLVLSHGLLQEIGNASYSIYLTHVFVGRVFEKFPMPVRLEGNTALSLVAALVLFVAMIVAGMVTHRLIERPLNRAFDRMLRWAARARPLSAPESASRRP